MTAVQMVSFVGLGIGHGVHGRVDDRRNCQHLVLHIGRHFH